MRHVDETPRLASWSAASAYQCAGSKLDQQRWESTQEEEEDDAERGGEESEYIQLLQAGGSGRWPDAPATNRNDGQIYRRRDNDSDG